MKISAGKADGFIKSPPRDVRCILLFGPDQGLVFERSKALAHAVLDDINDPFNSVILQASDIKSDPALIADEAAAMSLTGGRRFIRIQDAADSLTSAFKSYLSDPIGDAVIVLEGGELSARSSLRKLFESNKTIAAAVACYGDEGRNLSDVIRESLQKHGLNADRDAMGYLLNHLGSDRQVSRGELEKLAIYMGDETSVTMEHAMACVGDSGAFSLDNVIMSAGNGDHASLETALMRCFDEGNQPIMILRMLARHFHRLHLAKGAMQKGLGVDDAMRKLRPPVIFKQAPAFKKQLGSWNLPRIAMALEVITQAEAHCKVTGNPPETVCSRALMRIAQAARARR
ncbi:DNA polymerase III, delta subunit [Candidatus Terasakiella magnetica]|uniref:DNA polymerase III subunit delta n=1 Tax=Candidatus Terasakiella magnetica TaxID=1867952 RepID=A0A1C3RGN8_9PROT|nr:DNA polymerase III subunit delta [Candidatus Terasakiella magnetica]SCA56364.1 DNA polymerase III, delta subunit [Candidatus Terasakiella magnetica]